MWVHEIQILEINFGEPHWGMTSRDLGNIHNTKHSCRDTLLCGMAIKLPQYFYLLMEKFVLLTIMQHSVTRNHYSCILEVTGQFWDSQKRISININQSYHHRSSQVRLINDLDSILTNLIRKAGMQG